MDPKIDDDAKLQAQRDDYFRRMETRLSAELHRRFLLACGHLAGCPGLPCACPGKAAKDSSTRTTWDRR